MIPKFGGAQKILKGHSALGINDHPIKKYKYNLGKVNTLEEMEMLKADSSQNILDGDIKCRNNPINKLTSVNA